MHVLNVGLGLSFERVGPKQVIEFCRQTQDFHVDFERLQNFYVGFGGGSKIFMRVL